MFRGLYAAATGMDAAANAHEVTSRNLAHASVPGFRKTLLPFEAVQKQATENDPIQLEGTKSRAPHIDFTPGPLNQTGAPLDMALAGDGFFVVNGPKGPLYTRSGTFQLDGAGQLVNPDGLPVKSKSGTITVPENQSATKITVSPDGTLRLGAQEIGQLDIVSFSAMQDLKSVGSTLFEAPPDITPTASEAKVIQGAREMANVSPVNELVNLIAAQRHYEMAQKAASSIDRAVQKRIEAS